MDMAEISGKMKKDNRGITLVEIVVSMLILAIILVPLLSSFVTASKTNLAVKDNSYARAVGESVVESVKLLGVEGTALEFYKDVGDAGFLMAPNYTDFGETVPEGGHRSVITQDGLKKFSPQASGKYEYSITGIKQGPSTYDVKLKLDHTLYPNDYQYADLSAFASGSTALINPALQNSDYDYRALRYFKQLHERYQYSKYVAVRDKIEAENGKKWEDYYEALDAYNEEIAKGNEDAVMPSRPVNQPVPARDELLTDDIIKSDISKTLDISIEEKADAYGRTEYVLNSTMTYECDNRTRQYAASDDKITKMYSGYCTGQRYADISSLLVLYSPFSGADSLNLETVNIKKITPKDMDVYIILQADSDTVFDSSALKVNVDTGLPDKIRLFSQAALDVTPATIVSEKKLISAADTADDTIYNIDVEVYEGGGTYSRLVTTINSTLINR